MAQAANRAVLFDFDGTLAPTMEDNYRAWQSVFNEVGVEIGEEEYFLLEGLSLAAVAETLCTRHGVLGLDYKEIARRKEARYRDTRPVPLYPGVIEFLDTLESAGVPFALATAAYYDRLTRSVPSDFLNRFKAVITGDGGLRSKPFPDPYLEAARACGVPATACVVVENAPLGIRSGKAAGAYCMAISSTLAPSFLAEADIMVRSFADIPNTPVMREIVRGGYSVFQSPV